MAALKRVCRFNLWINPVFDARLRAEPDIDLQVGDLQGPPETLEALLAQAHVFHVSPARDELPRRWHVTDALLAGCPNLLAVSSGGAGFDTVDAAACTRAGIAVVNQVGGNARSVAELAIGLMLAVSRKICVSDRLLRTERGFSRESLMGHEIGGATLGLVGIGHTGREVAKLARGFDMRVLAYDPLLSADEIRARGAEPVDRARLLAESDIVSLHCPLDATTRGSFDAKTFAAMKPGALFITTARGSVHDEAALADALTAGHLAGAGLDVWAPEPPPRDSALLQLDTVVATYHTAGVTHEARRNVAAWGAEQIIGLLRGETPAASSEPGGLAGRAGAPGAVVRRCVAKPRRRIYERTARPRCCATATLLPRSGLVLSVRKIFHDPFKVILSLAPAIRRRSSLTASARLDHLGGLDAAWLENVAKKLKQSGLITPHLGAKIAASALIIVSSAVLTMDWARAEPAFEANHEVQLEELSVTGQGGGARTPEGYAPATTISATRTDTPLRDVPQTVVPVTRLVLEDAAATRIDTALDLAGVGRSNNFGGLGLTEVTIRGFSVFDYYRNGFPISRGYPNAPDVVAIERIEVLKGPSAFLYGRGDPGGTFNIVTKQPLAERSLAIGTQYGSYGAKRSTFDATGALDENGQVLARITGTVEDNGSFRDFVSGDRYHVAPVIAWKPSADTTITLEGAFVSTGTTFDRGIVPLQGRLRNVPRSRFLSEPGLPQSVVQDALGQLRIEHRFDQDWVLTAGAQVLGGSLKSWGVGAAANGFLPDGRTLRRNLEWRDLTWSDTDVQVNLAGKFDTGFLHHTLLLGLEYDRYRYREIFDRSNAATYPFLLDLLAPRYGQALPRSLPTITNFLQHTESYAGYVQDQIDITPQLHALVGVRVEDVGQDSTSYITNRTTNLRGTEALPRFGLVYDLSDAVSVYGNYARSFKPSTALDRRGQPLAFERGEGYEAGVKVGLLDGRLNATAAVFDIRRTNVPTTDPVDSAFSVAAGVVQSRGFDLTLAGELAPGLRVIGTYSYVDAAVARDNTIPVGTRLANIPANSFAMQAVYEVQGGALKGLGFGGGLNVVGQRVAGTALSTFTMPAYTVVNLISYYQITPDVRIYLNVDNLLDEIYYDRAFQNRYATPGQPRTIMGGVAARF